MFYSRVFDRKTGKLLGYLGNITIEGVMVISEEPISKGENYKLRMDLPEYIYKKPVLNFCIRTPLCGTGKRRFFCLDLCFHRLFVIPPFKKN